jgi:long-subunit fatty acid transport protein
MKSRAKHGVLAVAILACLGSQSAFAITNVEANAGPQFNFVNPGARSLGMAGAFTGLADDSTAAYTNPAGLAQLSRKEWSIEVRHTEFDTTSVRDGRMLDTPTGIGVDTIDGLRMQDTTEEVNNLSFLSFALPLEKGTVAFYRHELANFEANFTSLGIITQTAGPAVPIPLVDRIPPSISDMDLQIVNYGIAGSWRASDTLMVGGSLNYYRFDFDTTSLRYSLDANHDGVITNTERLTTLDFSDASLARVATQNGDDGAIGFTLGLLWQPNDRWSVGTVYRHGPSFDYDYGVTLSETGSPPFDGTTEFKVPSVWAVGVGYRPSDSWRIALDASRVFYSQHSEDVEAQVDGADVDYLRLDDGTEIRLGFEYTAINAKNPYQIRFGAWHEPAHQLYFDGVITPYTGTPIPQPLRDVNYRAALFQRGDDAMHYTAGYGIVFKKFQLDAAVDMSEQTDTFSLSMVYFLK